MLQGPIRLKVLWGTRLGNNEILASRHDIAALKVKQRHFALRESVVSLIFW